MNALPFRLLLITDEESARAHGRSTEETVGLALEGGGPSPELAVLLRAKSLSKHALAARARSLLPIVEGAGARLLVHGHPSLVARLRLAGAHMSSTAPLRTARAALPEGALLGASRHAGDALCRSALAPLDYITLSPVFSPTSKPSDARPCLGLEGLARLAAKSARPVVALGGLTPERAYESLEAGAAAAAVLGGVMAAQDPAAALRAYLGAARA